MFVSIPKETDGIELHAQAHLEWRVEASRRNSGASRVVLGYAHWVPLNETNTEWMEGTKSASCLALVCLARSRGSDPGIAKGGAVLPKDLMAVSVPKKVKG
jgi:hypothetical protein